MNALSSIPPGWWAAYCFVLGLPLGSFLNVCIHRLPLGQSIVMPPSRCPSCKQKISAWNNIPVFSFVLLRGKCRNCESPISWVYPTVEIITALLLTTVYLKFGLTLRTLIYAITLATLVVITVIDVRHQIIPDRITLPGIVFGLIAGIYLNGLRPTLIGLFLGSSLFYILTVVSRGGMGGGDIKFIAAAGALLGWKKTLLVIFLGAFLGTVYSFPLLMAGKKNRKSLIPFGPFLAAGTGLAIFSGNQLIALYLQFMSGRI